jgi:26S proteasome regulatory subunit N2
MQVLRLLVKLYESSDKPDWVSICQCLMFLDDASEVAKILHQLLKGGEVSSASSPAFRS